tara:strand:+ start:5199 stop:5432 length:234 start_codon:yes stop_codon:yes gene_type:complete
MSNGNKSVKDMGDNEFMARLMEAMPMQGTEATLKDRFDRSERSPKTIAEDRLLEELNAQLLRDKAAQTPIVHDFRNL